MIEIERRFLVKSHLLPRLSKGATLIQAYLSTKPVVRVRVATVPETEYEPESVEAFLTIKGEGTLQRAEFEYNIPYRHAMQMFDLASEHRVHKIRRKIEVAGKTWEVDEFCGRLKGLWLAEIELDSVDETFEEPEWVGQEVTDDPRYTNVSLAMNGLPVLATTDRG